MVVAVRKTINGAEHNLVEFDAPDKDEVLETDVEVKLKWFNQPKGFGFVVPNNKDVDAFLHITTLQKAEI